VLRVFLCSNTSAPGGDTYTAGRICPCIVTSTDWRRRTGTEAGSVETTAPPEPTLEIRPVNRRERIDPASRRPDDASARGSRPRSNPRPRLGDPSPILDFGTDPLGAAQGVLPAPRAHRQPVPNRSLGRPALGIDGPHCRPTAVVTARPRGSRDGASVLAMGTYRPRGPVDPVETGRWLALSRASNGQQVL